MKWLLGLDYKTVLHHVTILASLGVIERTGDGQHPLFPKDARWGVDAKRQALAQATPVGSAVMAVLVPGQDIEVRHLAAHLEMPKSSVSTALGRLEDAGLVVRRRQGRSVFVRLVESGTPSTSPMYPVPPA